MSDKMDPRIKLIERLKIQLKGYVYVGDRKEEGWTKELPYYAFRCPEHGIVYDYPHGYKQRLECPLCREERIREKKIELSIRNEDIQNSGENNPEVIVELFEDPIIP